LEPLQGSKTIVFSIVLDRRRPKSPKSRNREGWVLELTRRQTTLIRALSDREQAASPPSPKRGRASRAQGEDPHPRQDPGNHARWPHRRTRSGAPAPCGWPGLSIPASSAPIPPPCAELRAGLAGAAPGIHYSSSLQKCRKWWPKNTSFSLGFGKQEIEKVPGAPFSAKRGPWHYLLFAISFSIKNSLSKFDSIRIRRHRGRRRIRLPGSSSP